jgi:hypothetical protein
MTLLLLAIISWIAVKSKNLDFWPLAIFVILGIIFHFFAPYIDSWHYHIAGLFDLGVLWGLSRLVSINKLVKILCVVTFMSLLLNIAGWVIYELYFPPLAYDIAFNVLYALTIVAILTIRKKNGGIDSDRKNIGTPNFFNFSFKSHYGNF